MSLPPGVVPFSDWSAKGRWWPSSRRRRQSDAIVVHHSVTDTTGRSAYRQAQDVEAVIYGRRLKSRFSMVAYSWIVATDGTIFEGRGTTWRNGANNDTKGTGYGNANTMSVCFAGNYHPNVAGVPTLTPTPTQLRAVGDLIAWLDLAKELTADYVVLPHRTVHGTACPGDHLADKVDELEMYSRMDPTGEDGEMILLHNTAPEAWYVCVPGVGKAKVDEPGHWAQVIAEGRQTGTYTSPYFDELMAKMA